MFQFKSRGRQAGGISSSLEKSQLSALFWPSTDWERPIHIEVDNLLYIVCQRIVDQLLSHVRLFATPWTAACQASCPSLSPGACSDTCPLSHRCHPTISSLAIPFFSYLHSFPGSSPVSWLFASGGQSIGTSASASVPPMNIQDWFPLEFIGLISL